MRLALLSLLLSLLFLDLAAQKPVLPAAVNGFSKATGYDELTAYIGELDKNSTLLETEIIGQSVLGRDIYALKFSSGDFGNSVSKVKVLIFAQQHGNEQSGKEGALLLAAELLDEHNLYLFNRIDLMLIPQLNPDGSEINRRRNANDMDLNRNHLILTEPETQALHGIFDRYMFEVSLDVHEYSPYGEDWKRFGYRKNSEVTLGTPTNLNVSEAIRNKSNTDYLPYIIPYLEEKGFSANEYFPGGPPDSNYIRHSTFDINDGRQSLAVQNTFAFIQEGMNGEDTYVENLERRAEGQCAGMMGLLKYAWKESRELKKLVSRERRKLSRAKPGEAVVIQSEHVSDGRKLALPLFSCATSKDTVMTIRDYRPEVISLLDVSRPVGYLIPKEMRELMEWAVHHSFQTKELSKVDKYRICQYFIQQIDTIDFEGDPVINPIVEIKYPEQVSIRDYIFIPTKQLKGNMLMLALEPKSMLGLATYEPFAHLVREGEAYPVLRVEKK